MNDEQRPDEYPQARYRRSRWPGWVWSLPIAAMLIVGYLGLRQITSAGPSVTVIFPTGAAIKPDDTKVQYQGLQVGKVASVALQSDMRHIKVRLDLQSDMAGHLGPGTRFWIVGGTFGLSKLSDIKTIITGPFIGMDPRPGKRQDRYRGLSNPPALTEKVPGRRYTLTARALGNISPDSPIYYRGTQVGKVESQRLGPDGRQFTIAAFIRAPFDKLVHAHSHFWDGGAVQVAMGAAGPRLQIQSIPALVDGAVAFDTPAGAAAGKEAPDGASFTLYASKSAAENAPVADSVRYRVAFDAAEIGDLTEGAPVELASRTIGSVRSSDLQYDPQSGKLTSQVTLTLDPTHFTLAGGAQWQADPRPQMDALLRHLIAQGLRARIGKTVPLVGGEAVDLAFVPNAMPATLGGGDEPEIPAAPRSGIRGLIASVSSVGAKLDAMPIDQIAGDVHKTTQKLAELSQSQELKDSLQHLDRTMANVDAVAHTTRRQIGPVLARLRMVADEAQAAVRSANSLIASNGNVRNEPGTSSLGSALYELSRAARSLRGLADYLDRHPEALIRGKGESG